MPGEIREWRGECWRSFTFCSFLLSQVCTLSPQDGVTFFRVGLPLSVHLLWKLLSQACPKVCSLKYFVTQVDNCNQRPQHPATVWVWVCARLLIRVRAGKTSGYEYPLQKIFCLSFLSNFKNPSTTVYRRIILLLLSFKQGLPIMVPLALRVTLAEPIRTCHFKYCAQSSWVSSLTEKVFLQDGEQSREAPDFQISEISLAQLHCHEMLSEWVSFLSTLFRVEHLSQSKGHGG